MFPCSQAESYLSYFSGSLKAFLVRYPFDCSLNRVSITILILLPCRQCGFAGRGKGWRGWSSLHQWHPRGHLCFMWLPVPIVLSLHFCSCAAQVFFKWKWYLYTSWYITIKLYSTWTTTQKLRLYKWRWNSASVACTFSLWSYLGLI